MVSRRNPDDVGTRMIDLADYTLRRRKILLMSRMECVYVVGPADGGIPCKIGVTGQIWTRFPGLQANNWNELAPHFVLWTPGSAVASSIETACQELLAEAGKHRLYEWFNVTAEWGRRTVETIARERYPAVRFFTHAQMMAELDSKREVDRDYFNERGEIRTSKFTDADLRRFQPAGEADAPPARE